MQSDAFTAGKSCAPFHLFHGFEIFRGFFEDSLFISFVIIIILLFHIIFIHVTL